MTGSEYGRKTGQHEQPKQQAELQMRNYCDCGDYCEWCHPEMCEPVMTDAERLEAKREWDEERLGDYEREA